MITDGTIKLRAMEPRDEEVMYCWENDTSLWHLGDTMTPFSRHIIRRFIDSATEDIYTTKQLRLIIEYEGGAIGAMDLFDFNPLHSRAGVGILIYDEKNRNLGYGERALKLMIEYAFDVLKLKQLYAHIPESNLTSLALFRKLGFSRSGLLRNWLNGGENVVIKQLIRDDI